VEKCQVDANGDRYSSHHRNRIIGDAIRTDYCEEKEDLVSRMLIDFLSLKFH
jgi:hypothetical protein